MAQRAGVDRRDSGARRALRQAHPRAGGPRGRSLLCFPALDPEARDGQEPQQLRLRLRGPGPAASPSRGRPDPGFGLAAPTLGELSSWFPEQLAAPGCRAALERLPAPQDPGASLLAALSRSDGLGPLPRGRPSSQWTSLVKAHVTPGLGVTSWNKTASSLPPLGPQVTGPSSSTSLGWPGVSAADPFLQNPLGPSVFILS